MKAVLFNQHGDSEVRQYMDHPTPEAGPGEVRIRLKAAALNRVDLWVRNDCLGIKLKYLHIPGADYAGVVDQVGEAVEEWQIGDRVVICWGR